jgi:hypothetical protein
MEPPLCWVTNLFDRSPAEPLWVESEKWGPLNGRLLSLSYGYGRIFVVPHETVGTGEAARVQGGVSPLPIPDLPTGLVRGRFHPGDGHLYACGMFAWAGDRQQPGGLYRVRRTDRPVHLPVEFHARRGELQLAFTGAFDRDSAGDAANYAVRAWSLKRTEDYGSEHVGERALNVTAVRLADDGRTIVLEIPDLAPTKGLSVRWDVKSADGSPVGGELQGTIHDMIPK